MPARAAFACAVSAAGILLAAAADAAADQRRTFRMDAVELIAGREAAGVESITVAHGGYTYWFSTPENKAAFEREPRKYEVQFGGACARMGPLSGACGCDIYAVHDGKLYFFASPQCRDSFLKAPQKLIETDDDPPAADGNAAARGRDLVELAVTFCGGAEKIDGIRTYRQRIESTSEHQGKPVRESSTCIIAFPNRFRYEDTWGDSMWGHVAVGDSGFFVGSGGDDRPPMVAEQIRAVRRVANRNLLVIFRARTQAGFVASALGTAKVGDMTVERVAIAFDGTTTTLGIDPATGKVLSMSFVARGPRSAMGVTHKTILDYKTLDGVTLPWRWSATFDGDEKNAMETPLTSFEIDPPLDESLFKPTER